MIRLKNSLIYSWTAVIGLLGLNVVVFCVLIVTAGNELRVQYIPDDGFYYLTLARNFSLSGLWTFDSGVSVTSGFHLLFAYLLAGSHWALGLDPNNFVISGILIGLFFTLSSIVILGYWGFKQKNILFLMFLALVITSQNFVYNTVSLTEWSIGVFVSSLYCVWFFAGQGKSNLKSTDFVVLFLLGLLSSVARSDSGLLPFSIFAAVFIYFLMGRSLKGQLYFAAAGLAGTVAGLVVVFGHNFIFANEFLQSSARMKAYWGEFVERSFYPAPVLISSVVGTVGLLLLAGLLGAVVWPRFFRKETALDSAEIQNTLSVENQQQFFIMLVSSGLCLTGYTIFYSFSGGIQPWYSGNLIVPLMIFIFGLCRYIAASLSDRAVLIFGFLFLATVVFNVLNLYPVSSENASWPYHQYMYEAGLYLSENPPDSAVGSWNAGIIGYYEGGGVINLDGLVNKDIYEYAVENDLAGYLKRENIVYVVDFERMIGEEIYRLRGGYDDEDFVERFIPQMVFDEGQYGLTFYFIEDGNS